VLGEGELRRLSNKWAWSNKAGLFIKRNESESRHERGLGNGELEEGERLDEGREKRLEVITRRGVTMDSRGPGARGQRRPVKRKIKVRAQERGAGVGDMWGVLHRSARVFN